MICDLSNAKWELSQEEKYAIDWFEKNGFDVKMERQYVSKTIFTVSKNGLSDKFELPQGGTLKDFMGYMNIFKKQWEMFYKLQINGERR